jgi:hypothetical protein
MEDDTPTWTASPLVTGLLLLALLISPVGAPVLLVLVTSACEIPWDGEVYRCMVPRPVTSYLFLSILIPSVYLKGAAVVWFAMRLAGLVAVTWMFVRATWERLFPL